ncbi:MAG: phosphate ABC transporter permease subunit PstC [Pseudonocardiaceae bacterium]
MTYIRTAPTSGPEIPTESARTVKSTSDGADRVFRLLLLGAGLTVLIIMITIGLFLFFRGSTALLQAGPDFLTTQAWEPDSNNFGVAAVVIGTLLIAGVAILFAVPLATGVALYISEYAPRRIRSFLINLVDLMAAVPSVVYGLWGFALLQEQVIPVTRWISATFGWVPLLGISGTDPNDPLATETVYKSSTFIAGIVVALMVMPIICSVMRESFSAAPPGEREGAYALGATKWGVIRSVVVPFGLGGMIGGTMLGLGRAMGETIAVYLIISPIFVIQPEILRSGASSVAALIAQRFGAATPFELSALMAAGLALFALTLVVNFSASAIIARTRSGALSEA